MKYWLKIISIALLFTSQMVQAQTAETIIDAYEKTRGGKQKLLSIQSIVMQGSREMMGNEVAVTITKVNGKLSRNKFEMGGTNGFILLTDKEGWNYFPMRQQQPNKMSNEGVVAMQTELDIAGPLVNYAAKGYTALLVGKELAADGTECYKINLQITAGKEITYWINTSSYLLVQSTSIGKIFGVIKDDNRRPNKENTNQITAQKQQIIIYKDYKAVEGILYRLCLFYIPTPLSLYCNMNKLYRHFTRKYIEINII